MKKLLLLVSFCGIIFLSGCSPKDIFSKSEKGHVKYLVCNGTLSSLDTTVKLGYDSSLSTVVSAHVQYVMDISKYSQVQKDALKKTNMCSSLDSSKFENCETTFTDDKMTVNTDMNVEEMRKEEFQNKKVALDTIKKAYEQKMKGKCTIE